MSRRAAPVFAFVIWAVALISGFPAQALQSADGNKNVAAQPSLVGDAITYVIHQQRAFHRTMIRKLRLLTVDQDLAAAIGLITISFLYGVFHAAGPGHGKAVLATYLLTQRERLVVGVRLAVASAFLQGLTALAIVYGLVWLFGWLPKDTTAVASWSERVSYGLVFAIGVLLTFRSGKFLFESLRSRIAAYSQSGASDPSQTLRLNLFHRNAGKGPGPTQFCGCDHQVVPTARQIAGAKGFKAALGVVLSIGLRPCSGAILVLVFARTLDLAWAGPPSVIAMSVGTAVTVAFLALAVTSMQFWVTRLFRHTGEDRLKYFGSAVSICGGIALILLGVSAMIASFSVPPHPLRMF